MNFELGANCKLAPAGVIINHFNNERSTQFPFIEKPKKDNE